MMESRIYPQTSLIHSSAPFHHYTSTLKSPNRHPVPPSKPIYPSAPPRVLKPYWSPTNCPVYHPARITCFPSLHPSVKLQCLRISTHPPSPLTPGYPSTPANTLGRAATAAKSLISCAAEPSISPPSHHSLWSQSLLVHTHSSSVASIPTPLKCLRSQGKTVSFQRFGAFLPSVHHNPCFSSRSFILSTRRNGNVTVSSSHNQNSEEPHRYPFEIELGWEW